MPAPEDETQQRVKGTPKPADASAPDDARGTARGETGRGERLDDSPEARMMRGGTLTTSNPLPLPPDMDRADFDEIDNAAADEARNDVRRRERSAD
ncbi:MAG TPA: hypothetical protein VK886_00460 [Vicinamibacterales bacterium]|nr:hypothetical protein [Vicinamibacterales bacterium]